MVTRTGTPGDDNIRLDEESTPDGGRFVEAFIVDALDGNNNVRLSNVVTNRTSIKTEGGQDEVVFTGSEVRESTLIDTGDGFDHVIFENDAAIEGYLQIKTGAGNDIVKSELYSVTGSNYFMSLGSGNDRTTITSTGSGSIFGDDGNDKLSITALADGKIRLYGGDGRDVLSISTISQDQDDLSNNVLFSNDANLNGSILDGGSGNDHFNVDINGTKDFQIRGGDGFDRVNLKGDDNVFRVDVGDGGSHTEIQGNSRVFFKGGTDVDVIHAHAADGRVTIHGGKGNDSLNGSSASDLMFGGDDDDFMFGGGSDDSLNGGGGNDKVLGGDGSDYLEGGDDNDSVEGGDGNDTIHTGKGQQDQAIGGRGADRFLFEKGEGTTYIRDFIAEEGDHLHIRGLDISVTEILASAKQEYRQFEDQFSGQEFGDQFSGQVVGGKATVLSAEGTEIVMFGVSLDELSEASIIAVDEDAAVG